MQINNESNNAQIRLIIDNGSTLENVELDKIHVGLNRFGQPVCFEEGRELGFKVNDLVADLFEIISIKDQGNLTLEELSKFREKISSLITEEKALVQNEHGAFLTKIGHFLTENLSNYSAERESKLAKINSIFSDLSIQAKKSSPSFTGASLSTEKNLSEEMDQETDMSVSDSPMNTSISESSGEERVPSEVAERKKVEQIRVIALQKFIRGKKVQDVTVMPSELKTAWASIPALHKMSASVQNDFSLIIARELQKVIADPDLHQKDIYFSKSITYDLPDRESTAKAPWTFYIKVDLKAAEGPKALISMHQKTGLGSFIGEGAFKIVHRGYELQVPLRMDKDGRLIAETSKALARSADPVHFQEHVIEPNKIHQEVYDLLKSKNKPGRITEPAKVREHKKKGVLKQELVQRSYIGDVEKLNETGSYIPEKGNKTKKVSYESRLALMEDLFEIVESLGALGLTHRDVKGKNVLLGEESDDLHAYLHDFDLVNRSALGYSANYVFWDMGGQIGLVSQASDIVGAMLTTCSLICKDFDTDFKHSVFKQGDLHAVSQLILPDLNKWLKGQHLPQINFPSSIEEITKHLASLAQNSKYGKSKQILIEEHLAKIQADIKIIQAFCKVFKNEENWKKQMVGSCLCHFAGITRNEFKTMPFFSIENKFKKGINNWVNEELTHLLSLHQLELLGLEVSNMETVELIEALCYLYENELGKFKIFMPPENIKKLSDLLDNYNSLRSLLQNDLPKEADPFLFSSLNSNDPIMRQQGQEILHANFGRAADLKNALGEIRQEYTAQIKTIRERT